MDCASHAVCNLAAFNLCGAFHPGAAAQYVNNARTARPVSVLNNCTVRKRQLPGFAVICPDLYHRLLIRLFLSGLILLGAVENNILKRQLSSIGYNEAPAAVHAGLIILPGHPCNCVRLVPIAGNRKIFRNGNLICQNDVRKQLDGAAVIRPGNRIPKICRVLFSITRIPRFLSLNSIFFPPNIAILLQYGCYLRSIFAVNIHPEHVFLRTCIPISRHNHSSFIQMRHLLRRNLQRVM